MTRLYAAELIGTLILVTCGIGTGIMGTDLAQGNLAIALFANAFATGLVLYLLITILGPVSGAHMNPAVTLYFLLSREIGPARAGGYVVAQLAGALLAVGLSHLMFSQPVVQTATTARAAPGLWLGEAIATFGLCLTIAGARLHAPGQLPALVGAWIASAFWFTSSASFANPAVTVARMFSDTFTGILPANAPAYIAAQLAAALVAALTLPKLFSR
ncbi:aquaporin [Frigidibacter sp. RF13]|uniref:aquaporin n=1 Tax=Frigidibacter sp. RF13 TaxID=2997340 RepID=UPI00226E7C1A|nr:aquaporin [Frigidibacter sp. RF13]MCY1125574.1 aquaporin [Frigidibacter sp. RF13]